MSFGGLVLTNGGRYELAKAETGERFEITHIVLGEGAYSGSVTGIQAVASPVMELPVSKIERNGSEVVLECDYNSTDVPKPFYFREIGVVANGVLCFYDNSRDDAEYIDPDSGVVVKQKRIRLVLLISSEVNITATIAGNLYALDEDLERHTGNEDIHVTSEEKKRLDGIEEGAQKNVQADWNETDEESDGHIKNKPAIPSKASDVGAVSADDLTTSIGTVGLSAAGWYRIAEYIAFSDVGMQGASGTSCTISIKRHYNNTNNEYHKVELLGIFQKAEFKDVSNKSNTQIITKIRNVYDNGHLFLEIYYSSSGTNDIDIIIENARAGAQIWKVIDPVVTSETMSGATVYASMDLPANSHGSASSAEKLQTARNIGNVSFDGSKDISLEGMGAVPRYKATIDLSDTAVYAEDTYYPVVSSDMPRGNGFIHIEVEVSLNSDTKPSWSSHPKGFSCHLDVQALRDGYGETTGNAVILDSSYAWTNNNINPCGYTRMIHSGQGVLWLRGGGKYFVFGSTDLTWMPQSGTYTVPDGTASVSPSKTIPALDRKSTITANLNGDATGSAARVNGHTVDSDVPANAEFTDTKVQSKVFFDGNLDLSSDHGTMVNVPNISQYDQIIIETTYGNIVLENDFEKPTGFVFRYTAILQYITLVTGFAYVSNNILVISSVYNHKIESGTVTRSDASNMSLFKVKAYKLNAEVV